MASERSEPELSPDRAWRNRIGQLRHDLVNPLGEILGFSDMLIEENAVTHPAVADGLDCIRLAARHVLADVDRALHPDTLRADPTQLAPVAAEIRRQLDEIATTASRIIAISEGAERDDLVRIADSANRLREMQTATFALVAALPPPAEVGPSAGVKQAPSDSAPLESQSPVSAHPPPKPATTPSILVVDDQEPNRALLERRLQRRGYSVELAESGRAALDLLRARHFDLVLLDIVMPEIDGFEVLRLIKEDSRLAHIPVIMLSAFDDLNAVVRCVELGAEDYLPKPFPAALLHARVDACLASKRMSDQLRKYAGWLFGPTLFLDAVAAPASLVLKRQERTVLFADIRGFTQWSERHTPEETVAMLNLYFETAEKVWADSAPIKTEYTGDEIMGVFPTAAETVRIGQALRLELGRLLARFDLGLGVGINTGSVIEGLVGGAEVKAYRFVGDTVNTAKRICSEAISDQVLLANSSVAEAGDFAICGPEFPIVVKGKTEPLMVRALLELVAPDTADDRG